MSRTQCQRCAATTQLWLCRACESDLRGMLLGLPRYLRFLIEKVLGQTREGESTRRSSDLTTPMPVNLTASQHLDNIHAMLMRWVQDLCETRGITSNMPRMVPRDFIGPLPEGTIRGHATTNATISAAIWLANHTSAIACNEAAGMCFNEIRQAIDTIESVINRPIPPRDLGPCPTLIGHHQQCAARLSAPRKATEIRCPACKTLHQVDYLIELLRNFLLYEPLSSVEILGSRTSEAPGALDYWNVTLPRSTFHYWRKNNMITVRSYRNRETLAIMPAREDHADEPLYWLADVLNRMGVQWAEIAS